MFIRNELSPLSLRRRNRVLLHPGRAIEFDPRASFSRLTLAARSQASHFSRYEREKINAMCRLVDLLARTLVRRVVVLRLEFDRIANSRWETVPLEHEHSPSDAA